MQEKIQGTLKIAQRTLLAQNCLVPGMLPPAIAVATWMLPPARSADMLPPVAELSLAVPSLILHGPLANLEQTLNHGHLCWRCFLTFPVLVTSCIQSVPAFPLPGQP